MRLNDTRPTFGNLTRIESGSLFAQRRKNLMASWALLAVVTVAYSYAPSLHTQLTADYRLFGMTFTGQAFFVAATLAYAMLLLGVYLFEPNPRTSKSIYCLRGLRLLAASPVQTWRRGLPGEERLGLLTILLKAFFAPLMVMWLLDHVVHMITNGTAIFARPSMIWTDFGSAFDAYGFWFLLQLVIFVDVFFFTIGYLIELPGLNNEIRSVDPTWLGWAAALACYPPFSQVTSSILGWQTSDFPHFDEPAIHLSLNILLLALMAIYASASVALNFKASNLTHRGVVCRGPYRVIRHPAYVCKNLAWWVGATPVIAAALQQSLWQAVLAAASVLGWSLVYVLRALTEEDHLRRVNSEYDAYCARVRYRFIPGLI